MPRSLTARLAVASLCVLPVLLIISSYLLDSAFRNSVLRDEEEQLKTQVYLLLGQMEFDDELWMPEYFQEPRLNQLDSGLYGMISSPTGDELWRSPSARLLELKTEELNEKPLIPGSTHFSTVTSNAGRLYVFHYDIQWVDEVFLRISTLHSQDGAKAEISEYRSRLWYWLLSLTVLIIVAQTIILRWSLKPLYKLSKDIESVEAGTSTQLSGAYPTEIQSVTDNFNRVLVSEKNRRERYRHTLNDLAHSLKTPLAAIQSQLNSATNTKHPEYTDIIGEQVARMNQIVSHQLARAAHTYNHLPGQSASIKKIVKRLCESLQKVYWDKKIRVDINIDETLEFNGDESDLMELMGNLIDNAFKYGKNALKINAGNHEQNLEISVADDGPGISPERRQIVLQRGARADSATLGQGIGLAVAIDIISSYKGSLEILESQQGGSLFVVKLPINF